LPYHKVDQMFQDTRIVVAPKLGIHSPIIFNQYITLCNAHFPIHLHLWVTSSGAVPTCSWFIHKFCMLEPDLCWAGQSM
ncbi:hypothetical protein GYMLUDRAFT_179737, partial [Collybiopsis luxurians FD-317 M1]